MTVQGGRTGALAPESSEPRPEARTPGLWGPDPPAGNGASLGDPPCRILVAHEPLAYREALAGALRVLRPDAEVAVVAPMELDKEVERRRPDLVYCSRLSQSVQARAWAWALMYPGGKRVVETSVAGERALVDDLSLDAALALVDRVAGLARSR